MSTFDKLFNQALIFNYNGRPQKKQKKYSLESIKNNFLKMKKSLYIMKIGGSVATYKNRIGFSIRKKLLQKIALNMKTAIKNKKFNLVIIHGAGALGHQIAKKYNLEKGAGKNPRKWRGCILSRIANQKLNLSLFEIFAESGIRIIPVHTASVITQKNKSLYFFNIDLINKALSNNCVPLLYGEMVFDDVLGMSICSGDAIIPYLSKKLSPEKVFFASDVNGIYDRDPYQNKKAKLIEKISIAQITKIAKFSNSHNIDVTGGFAGKIKNIQKMEKKSISSIEIFNGLVPENYRDILLGKSFPHTKIKF